MGACERDEFDSLVNNTIVVTQEKMRQIQHGGDDAHCAKVATILIFKGKLCSAVRYIIEH